MDKFSFNDPQVVHDKIELKVELNFQFKIFQVRGSNRKVEKQNFDVRVSNSK